MSSADPRDYTLYLVTDAGLSKGRSHESIVRAALGGGVTVVQYREKQASTARMVEEARRLGRMCREAGVAFIVNDRLDVALAVEADGLHVGQEDMPAGLARKLLGAGRILGVSAGTAEEARRAEAEGADYIGASPVFQTPTKPDAPTAMGLEGLAAVVGAVSIPVVAIGGVNEGNVASMIRTGAAGVAVVSAIVSAVDVEEAARRLLRAAQEARQG